MSYHISFTGRIVLYVLNRLVYLLPDKLYIKLKFRLVAGYSLDLSTPVTFNEKLQWLKFNDIHPEYGALVDKALVKDYVAAKVGDKYLIPTIGVYDKLTDIDWVSLPAAFVLKCTGDSGGVVICTDKNKLDIQGTIKYLCAKSKKNYYIYNKEYPYKYVKPRFIIEEYKVDESGYELKDYKIFCFNGIPRYIQVDFDRHVHHRRNLYDTDWNLLDLQIKYDKGHDKVIDKPLNLEEMLNVASTLSQGMPHVRVDLYNIRGQIYFGELTFFHGSGMEVFTPHEWDIEFGNQIILSDNKN